MKCNTRSQSTFNVRTKKLTFFKWKSRLINSLHQHVGKKHWLGILSWRRGKLWSTKHTVTWPLFKDARFNIPQAQNTQVGILKTGENLKNSIDFVFKNLTNLLGPDWAISYLVFSNCSEKWKFRQWDGYVQVLLKHFQEKENFKNFLSLSLDYICNWASIEIIYFLLL